MKPRPKNPNKGNSEKVTHKHYSEENMQKALKEVGKESLIDMPIVTTTMSTLNTPSVTNLTPVKLSDILLLPKSTQRKGVKNSVKNPFVLTSADKRAKENEKIWIKQEKAEGIKKRKEDRERKKLEKEKVQKMPKSKKNAKDDVVKFLLSEFFYNFNKDATVVEKENEQHIDYTDEENRQSKRSKTYTTAELEETLTELDGYELISHLLKEHKLTSVGTVRKNKRQLPKAFIDSRGHSAAIFWSKFAFQNDMTLVSHIPKKKKINLVFFGIFGFFGFFLKIVILMSSLHHNAEIDESTREKRKPEINTFYNTTKGGVDVADELSASYDVSRNSKKWPLTIFYAMLNMAGIKAYIIHGSNTTTIQKRRFFIKTLGRLLVTEIPQLPTQLRKRIREFSGEPEQESEFQVYEKDAKYVLMPAIARQQMFVTNAINIFVPNILFRSARIVLQLQTIMICSL
ncbi:unnamed protein product [Arctia plantaginis]|uniref:PiggyBac transposable element-derived protein domain-containing protein n=1 Tax=Arctia plantaginis TaxID=874455 RepID=A0A8S0Z728_ARCPL|nr:unnamed protein product [Arctia plantaginis]